MSKLYKFQTPRSHGGEEEQTALLNEGKFYGRGRTPVAIRRNGGGRARTGGAVALCETLVEGEQGRNEAATMLHGNVQSRLSACNAWLAKAEKLLLAGSSPTPRAEDGAEGVPGAGFGFEEGPGRSSDAVTRI